MIRVQGRRRRHPAGHARVGLRAVRAVEAHARPLGGRPRRRAHAGAVAGDDARRHGAARTATARARAASSWCGCRWPTERPPAEPPTLAAAAPAARCATGPRIVVVEDNADSRELLCELLTQAGFDCQTAESGADGPGADRRGAPATSRSSTSACPGSTASRWRAGCARDPRHARHVPDRAHRLRPGHGPRRALDEAGFDEHLVKPVNVEEFLRLLTELRGNQPATAAAATGPAS